MGTESIASTSERAAPDELEPIHGKGLLCEFLNGEVKRLGVTLDEVLHCDGAIVFMQ